MRDPGRLFDDSDDLNDGGSDRSKPLSGGGTAGATGSIGRARAPARDGSALVHQAPAPDADAWRLEPHICRACFSRLVSRGADGVDRRYHCTNCGLEAVAASAEALCCCGTKIRRPTKGSKSGTTLVDAGIRCVVNPAPTPDFPSVIVAAEVSNSG